MEKLNTFINDVYVGELLYETSGELRFKYDEKYIERSDVPPVSLSLPFRDEAYTGGDVMNVFGHILPDDDDVKETLAERTDARGTDTFHLLEKLGRDCAGAIRLIPPDETPSPIDSMERKEMDAEQIGYKLRNLGVDADPLGISENEGARLSLAGQQEKTSLLRFDGNWYWPEGPTPSTHILKPQADHELNSSPPVELFQTIENEFFCMKLAKELGFQVPKTWVENFDGKETLVIERFDRTWSDDGKICYRLHQEDFCQALGSSQKYEYKGGPGANKCLELLREGYRPLDDPRFFIKRLAYHWIVGNTDSHAKNFSIFLQDTDTYTLTPMYDVVSMDPYIEKYEELSRKKKTSRTKSRVINTPSTNLAMEIGPSGTKSLSTLSPRHFLELAQENDIDPEDVSNDLNELIMEIPHAIENVLEVHGDKLPDNLIASITDGINERLDGIEPEKIRRSPGG